MIRYFLFLTLLLSALGRGARAQSHPESRLRLDLGATQEIQAPADTSLRLSQKKVIEVETLSPGRFRLLALRSGVVYIRAIDAQGAIARSWIVEVRPKSAGAEREQHKQKEWQREFCREKGVRCDEERRLLSGESDSLTWLLSARKRCEKEAPCRFEVQLSEAGRELWQQRLAEEWPGVALQLARDGFVILQQSCEGLASGKSSSENEGQIKELRRSLSERYGASLMVRCLNVLESSYVLDVLAVAQRSETAARDNPLRWENLALPLELPLRALVRGLSESGKAQVIAQPEVQLTEGSEVLIADGLEIQTVAIQDGHTASAWKSVGFQLRCALRERRKDRAHLKIELSLSRPRGERLDSSRLETEAWLNLQQWQLLGRIQASTEGEELSALPWLAAVPLIGPLFRWNLEQEAASEVSLFARLRLLEGESGGG